MKFQETYFITDLADKLGITPDRVLEWARGGQSAKFNLAKHVKVIGISADSIILEYEYTPEAAARRDVDRFLDKFIKH